MVIIKSTLLDGEHIVICTNADEYWSEIKRHGNMVIYHCKELIQFMGLDKDEIKTMHMVKQVFHNVGELKAPQPAKLSLAEMREQMRGK